MQSITKALVGTVAAGAMVVGSATPALAQSRDRHGNGIDAGDVIAGALIIGGIAAVVSAVGRNNRNDGNVYEGGGYDNRGYNNGSYNGGNYNDAYRYDDRYNQAGDPRQAVEQCVNVA